MAENNVYPWTSPNISEDNIGGVKIDRENNEDIPYKKDYSAAYKKPEPELMSGDKGYSKGLTDFTGSEKYKVKAPGSRLVLTKGTKDALDSLVTNLNTNQKSVYKYYGVEVPDTTPTLTATYIDKEDDIDGSYSHKGQTVGRVVGIDMSGMSESERARWIAQIKLSERKEGKAFSVVTPSNKTANSTDTLFIEYRGDEETTAPISDERYAELYEGLVTDRKIHQSNKKLRHSISENKPSGQKDITKTSKNASLTLDFNSPTPGAKWISPDGTVAPLSPLAKQHQLSAVFAGTSVSKLSIVEVPSTRATELISKKEMEDIRNEKKDKLFKNEYDRSGGNTGSIGLALQAKIEDGKDVPAQIRLYPEDENDGNPTQEWSQYKNSTVGYINCFLLRSVKARREERYFLFQSLYGDSTTFFFGERPIVYSLSGALLDTHDQQWLNDFQYYYDNYIRGSKSVLNKTRLALIYEDQILEGFVLNMNMGKSAEQNVAANFSFDMLVINRTQISGYTNPVERNSLEKTKIDIASQIWHGLKLISNHIGETLFASKDTLFDNKSGVYAPPSINPEDLKEQLPEVARANTDEEVENPLSSGDLRNSIENIRPGDLNSQRITVRTRDDMSEEEIRNLDNGYSRARIPGPMGV